VCLDVIQRFTWTTVLRLVADRNARQVADLHTVLYRRAARQR
jgi:hypothetical protein